MIFPGMDLFVRGMLVGFSLGAACALSLARKMYGVLPSQSPLGGPPATAS